MHLQIANDRILCEGIELLLLGGQDLQHSLIDGFVGKQTVHQYIPGLSHTVGTGDCLVFNGRCQLGFTEYHHTGCLTFDEAMARHKVPKYIEFVDSFPMNAAGKVLKYKMRQDAAERLGLTGDGSDTAGPGK